MLLHSIHKLANLALKETVPPQPRTSLHVTGHSNGVNHVLNKQKHCRQGRMQFSI